MAIRRLVNWPILLAVVMTTMLLVLAVGWVLLSVFGALANTRFSGLNWTLFGVGTAFLGLLVAGVIVYAILSIKAINLSQRQSNFIDSVTHELKSPIASMKLYLQTLCRRQVSPEEQNHFLQFMLEDIERLDHLVNQVLDAGRLEAERLDGELEELPLDEVMSQCIQQVANRYRCSPSLVDCQMEPCQVRARRSDLQMIFRNLLDNAFKYAGTPPDIRVSIHRHSARWAVVRVADNGPGIPLKDRRKIFGRFVRLGSELEREKPGTGLGLYIAKTAVRRLRGKIRVRDRRPPPGAVFEVFLPALPPPATTSALPSTEQRSPGIYGSFPE
ncbi:MAG: HAMP domain-containing histidine kinase [Thermoguttaceae bacterium]|nr:HAMP domain-containing histidine kinase [Thermoguttaceae bacterium]MDW8037359.1 HAMP domain-containing sensor histidine kinase [Thermoguttaceae bacterium]